MMKQVVRNFILLGLFTLLAACGGGGEIAREDNGTGGGSTPDPTPVEFSIVLSMVDSADLASRQLSQDNPLTIIATVTDSNGALVSDAVVAFTVEPNSLAVFDNDTGTKRTDENGIAKIGLIVGQDSGSGSVVATLPGGATANISFDSTGTPPDVPETTNITIVLVDENNQPSDQLNINNPLSAIVTVTDGNGEPIADEVVEFSFDDPEIAVFSDNGRAQTNAEGVATINFTVGEQSGGGAIIATLSNGASVQTSFSSEGPVETTISMRLMDQSGQTSNQLSVATPLKLRVILTDINNNPIADELITFSFSLENIAVFKNNDTGTASTDAQGVAEIELAVGPDSGSGNVVVSLASGESNAIVFDSAGTPPDVPDQKNIAMALFNQAGQPSTSLSQGAELELFTTVTDSDGNPLANQVVSFSLSIPGLAVFNNDAGTATTNAQGIAKIGLIVGDNSGSGEVIATLSNGIASRIAFDSAGAPLDNTKIELRLVDASGLTDNQLSDENPLNLIVKLTDEDNNPIVNESVSFSFSLPGLGLFNNDTGTALTNAQGEAQIGLLVGENSGSGAVIATLSSGASEFIAFESAGAPDPEVISISMSLIDAGNASSNQLADGNPLTLVVTLKDEDDNPVVNEVVSFAFSILGLAVFNNDTSTALTNGQGEARIGLIVGDNSGSGTIVATLANGETQSIAFESAGSVTDDIQFSLELNNTDTPLSSDNPLTLTVTLTNKTGEPIVDELVSFSFSIAGLAVFNNDSGTALTNALGQASIGLLVGSDSGSGSVIVTLSNGESRSIGFTSEGAQQDLLNIALEFSPSNELSNSTPLTLIVTVTDQNNEPLQDEVVTFAFSLPDIATFDNDSGTALTDVNGEARIGLIVGNESGSGTVTVSVGDGNSESIGFVSAGDLADAERIEMLLVDDSGFASNNLREDNPLTVIIDVLDGDNNIVTEQQLVTFSISPNTLARFETDVSTALTENGRATIGIIVGEESGSGLVTATLQSGVQASVGFDSEGTNVAVEEPASLGLFASQSQLSSSGSDTIQLRAIVKNEQNVLLENVEVTFSANAQASISSVSGTTDANGTATALLSTQNEPENRTITAQASVVSKPELTQTIEIAVVGTELSIIAPNSVIVGDSTTVTALLEDSDNTGIAGETITVKAKDSGGADTTNEVISVTNASDFISSDDGRISFTFSAALSGTYTIEVSALSSSVQSTFDIVVQEDQFAFENPPDINNIDEDFELNVFHPLTVTWLKDNLPFVGGTVELSISRGEIQTATQVTDATGTALFNVRSDNAGLASVLATGTDGAGNEVTARIDVSFIATEADSIIVDATPDAIGPDGQTSTISAVVRDSQGNRVGNKQVSFSLRDVANGSLSPAQVTTGRSGIASTVYTSNAVSSTEAVEVTATVDGISSIATLTVGDRPFDISLGTGNIIQSPNNSSYRKEFSVFVTDADGNPVPNADISMSITPLKVAEGFTFFKGDWTFDEDDQIWKPNFNAFCVNEDAVFNGVLDAGEDTNGDNLLTPGNAASITPAEVTTDENGQAFVFVDYPRQFGNWFRGKITARGQSGGSESRESMFFTLSVAADDLINEAAPPPNSPYGTGFSCNDTL